MTRKFYMRIKNGALSDPGGIIRKHIQGRKDGECVITIADGVDARNPKRSSPQNRYYWGVVVKMYLYAMIDTGDATIEDLRRELHAEKLEDALHECLLYHFAGCEVIDYNTGEVIRLPGRSSLMNTRDIGVYWDKVRDSASERYGVDIPPPPDDVLKWLNENEPKS